MSHETIYLHIWADEERGGTLRSHLRGARKQRRKRYGRHDSRGRLAGKKMIGERPAIVERRSRFGDWELDTVHGCGKACVVTAVERKSGLTRIGKLAQATAKRTTRRTARILQDEPHPGPAAGSNPTAIGRKPGSTGRKRTRELNQNPIHGIYAAPV